MTDGLHLCCYGGREGIVKFLVNKQQYQYLEWEHSLHLYVEGDVRTCGEVSSWVKSMDINAGIKPLGEQLCTSLLTSVWF
jgi:hypothetical protein